MKKNLYFLLICLLGVVIIVICPFFMGAIKDNNLLAMYLVAKILYGLLFVGSFTYCFVKKTANGITGSLVGISAIFQFIPLVIRWVFAASNKPVLWSIIILCVSLMIYLALFGGIITMGKKMVEADEKYQCNEIPVKKSEK